MKPSFKEAALNLWNSTGFRFILVGIVNTLVGTSVMFLLFNLTSAGYWVSSVMNYIVGSIVSYFLNKYFTFQDSSRSFLQVFRFALTIAVAYLVAYGLAKQLVLWVLAGFNEQVQGNIAMLIGMYVFVVLNYLMQRYFVFSATEEGKTDEC
ncbi:GtrA-like protein [Gleimia coleocanis DSM 15436]|uniref:GtrA-like protein n=1 Tax=Gleimia coleocanis DSM 15436 TaxID=525245 RepID=C0VZU8_9ACTO|nr:GtrA family protein [Gleimia coleocanis]EEH63807.1 GtrA-like protein [Gleimia coleocanis DSM 15436]